MSVDFDAIAQRGRCETSQLKLAFPLLEQGYTPPFLARYRSDVLGGLNEANLWSLDAARRLEEELSVARTELLSKWEETPLKDASIRMAIEKAGSTRLLTRLRRLVRGEMSGAISDSSRLAVAMIAPAGGQPIPEDLVEWASQIEGIGDASAATEGLDAALAQRLRLHPKLTAAAVRWLSKNAKIKVAKVHDPHLDAAKDQPGLETETPATSQSTEENSQSAAPVSELAPPNADSSTSSDSTAASDAVLVSETETALEPTSSPVEATEDDLASSEVSKGETAPSTEPSSVESEPPLADNASPLEASGEDQSAEEANSQEGQPAPNEIASEETNAASEETVTIADSPSAQETPEPKQASKGKAKASQKTKKITPRQRRRRWLVGVLKPLQGKSFAGDKLSAFQVVMLARALRSQVAECEFQYDAAKFVTELQTVAGSLNRKHSDRLKSIVMANEAVIRETAEQAWWDDLQQRASTKLVSTTADTLRRQVSRGSVEAKIVLAIDAVGPKTVAATIVSSDGRVLLCEDLPGQLSPAARSAAVARLGELIHLHHVDLLVISNGPARRSVLIALSELIKQSPDKSIRWTLSDRSGADAYAGSPLADQEMKSTPRRFRAAAWLAFSVIQPAQALAKVDPLKLRLGSFQKELSEDALGPVLEDILISGASRGGVDVNSASVSWLSRLPGVGEEAARNLDNQRREKLFGSREDIVTRGGLVNEVSSRQAVAFLRVFGSAETLDGTLVHPDDYPLARRLASALSIELPPECPPGYETPDFSSALSADETEAQPIEVVQQEEKAAVEDFTAQPSETQEFQIDDSEAADDSIVAEEPEASEGSEATAEASPEESSPMAGGEETPQTTLTETAQEETDTPPNGAGESPAEVMEESQEPTVSEPEAASEASESSTPVATVEVPEPIRRPMPESKSIDKCIKEWQIGKHSTHQIVRWLCDPFGDSDASGEPPAVMDQMPTNVSLKPGDAAVGVVVGVMPFGVFVELAPDCSGLIHVSRVADGYVDDLHEAVQVGDVMTVWIVGMDEKKKRLNLSALSPQRQQEIEDQRRQRRDDRKGGRGYRGQGRGSSDASQGQGNSRRQGKTGGRDGGGSQTTGNQRSGNQGSGNQGSGNQRSKGGPRDGGPRQKDGGRNRGKGKDNRRGGGRDRRGPKRDRAPESYRVVAKPETKPISDGMRQGTEPLRSFGDLAQFFDDGKKNAPPPAPKQSSAPEPEAKPPEQTTNASGSQPPSSDGDSATTDGESS